MRYGKHYVPLHKDWSKRETPDPNSARPSNSSNASYWFKNALWVSHAKGLLYHVLEWKKRRRISHLGLSWPLSRILSPDDVHRKNLRGNLGSRITKYRWKYERGVRCRVERDYDARWFHSNWFYGPTNASIRLSKRSKLKFYVWVLIARQGKLRNNNWNSQEQLKVVQRIDYFSEQKCIEWYEKTLVGLFSSEFVPRRRKK